MVLIFRPIFAKDKAAEKMNVTIFFTCKWVAILVCL